MTALSLHFRSSRGLLYTLSAVFW